MGDDLAKGYSIKYRKVITVDTRKLLLIYKFIASHSLSACRSFQLTRMNYTCKNKGDSPNTLGIKPVKS